MKKTLTVGSVESKTLDNGSIMVSVEDVNQGFKYSFFQKKQDGGMTKSYEGYEKLRPIRGDQIVAEVEDKPGTNKKTGEPTTYHNILFFYTEEKPENVSNTPLPKVEHSYALKDDPISSTQALNERLDEAFRLIRALESRVYDRSAEVPIENDYPEINIEDIGF